MKYIDVDKLLVEIRKELDKEGDWNAYADGYNAACLHILLLIRSLQQEHPDLPGIEESGIPGKDYIPVEWVDACEMYGKWKIVKQELPDVDLEKEVEAYYHENLGFIIGPNDTKVIVESIARHFYELGLNTRK